MTLDINTNISSLYAQSLLSNRSPNSPLAAQTQDPANIALSQLTQENINLDTQDMNNANQGISLTQTATSGLEQTENILQQMSSAAMEGASGILSPSELNDVQTEYSQLQSELNNIAGSTSFNGISLLQNPNGSVSIPVDNSSSDTVNLPQTDTTSLGIAATNVSTASNAAAAITPITNAINDISSDLAQIGSSQLALQNASTLDMNMATNSAIENSNLTDTNIASASTQTESDSILEQSNIGILAQANATSGYDALQLLSGSQGDSYGINTGSSIDMQL